MPLYNRTIKKNWNRKDTLWILRLVSMDFFENFPMKCLLKITSVLLCILTAVQTVIFFQKWDRFYFIKYLAVYSGSYFILSIILTIPMVCEISKNMLDRTDFWEVNPHDLRTSNHIKSASARINIYVLITMALGFVSGITHAVPLEDDIDIFFPLAIFKDYFPSWEQTFSWIYRSSFIIMPLIMPAPFHIALYFVHTMCFQVLLLMEEMKSLDQDIGSITDLEYQRIVKRKMEICIERHVQIIRVEKYMINKLSFCIITYSINSIILGLSIMVFHYTFQGSYTGRWPRLITLISAALMTFIHMIVGGQMVEDISNEMYELIKNLKWYLWNYENRRTYIILLIKAKQPLRVQFSEKIAVNYELGVGMVKFLYSALSIMSQLKNISADK